MIDCSMVFDTLTVVCVYFPGRIEWSRDEEREHVYGDKSTKLQETNQESIKRKKTQPKPGSMCVFLLTVCCLVTVSNHETC